MTKRKSTNGQQRSTKHTHKTKDRVIRTTLKCGDKPRCSCRISSSCSTGGTRRFLDLHLWRVNHTYIAYDYAKVCHLEYTIYNYKSVECPFVHYVLVTVTIKPGYNGVPNTDTEVKYHTKQYVYVLKSRIYTEINNVGRYNGCDSKRS